MAVLVPAYKEDGIIISTARNLLVQQYPKEYYDVYIIADSFEKRVVEELRHLPIHVFEVSFDKSTKTKSLNEAFSRIEKQYDIALICDADNILADDVLSKINDAFNCGARAVQARRVAKNLDTPFAILDACSEGVNNHIFRKGSNALGLSSAVIGSGMAFEFDTVKKVLSEISAIGGFDKILQLKIVGQGIKIYYLDDALVFDEKVSSSQAFQQQRKRWISSQFIYFRQFFVPAIKHLFKGNLSYFNLAILCNVVLPRAFLFILLPLLVLISFFISSFWIIAAASLLFIYLLTIALSVPRDLVNKNLWQAILRLPNAIRLMVGSLFQIKKAKQTFIHTVHTKTEVSNTLYNKNTRA
ncbi:MAG: glycosyltransferase [Chitinophagaceae bacterium]